MSRVQYNTAHNISQGGPVTCRGGPVTVPLLNSLRREGCHLEGQLRQHGHGVCRTIIVHKQKQLNKSGNDARYSLIHAFTVVLTYRPYSSPWC